MATGIRQQRGQATRTQILTVARRLFSDFTYHNTGIADIQDATGLTKGAFYHHFRTKQELALGVLELARAEYEAELIAPAMEAAEPRARLSALLDAFVELNERPEWLNCRLVATLSASITPSDGPMADAIRELHERLREVVETLLEEVAADGDGRGAPPRIVADLIVSTLLGLRIARKVGSHPPREAEVVEQLRRFAMPG